ncbi:MAG: GrpB family protein [Brachybacterium sp.]
MRVTSGDAGQPVELVGSRLQEWALRFEFLARSVRAALPDAQIAHIGSTAVPGLPAKDVVDLVVGVHAEEELDAAYALRAAGWDLEGERDGHCWLSIPNRQERKAVAHVVEVDGSIWRERVAFRDLLRQDAIARATYLDAKERAAATAEGWGDYTRAKAPIVGELLDAERRRAEQVASGMELDSGKAE